MPMMLLFALAAAGLMFFRSGGSSAASPKPSTSPKALPAAMAAAKAAALKVSPAKRTAAQDAALIKAAAYESGQKLPYPAGAKSTAQKVADLVSKGWKPETAGHVEAWQMMAGTKTQTGDYNAETIAALKKFGAKNVSSKTHKRGGK